jgi:hypothetical protein
LAAMNDPGSRVWAGRQATLFWRNSAAARHRAPLSIEGRSVWLTDTFPASANRKLLPGIAFRRLIFAAPDRPHIKLSH